MKAEDLLRQLMAEGFTIVGAGSRLLIGPPDQLTDEYRAQIACHKVELLSLVEHRHWTVKLPGRTIDFTVPQGLTRAAAFQHYATAVDASPSG